MQQETQKELLQQIAEDQRRPANEREAARRELCPPAQTTPSHRRGRNSNVPPTRADVDSDLEQALTFRSNDGLTMGDRIEITRGLDPAILQVLDAIQSNILLWLFTSNSTDVPVLIDTINRTGSDLVRTKSLDALRLIAARSPIGPAKIAAQTFLTQIDQEKP